MQSEANLQSKCIMWFRNTFSRVGCEPKLIIASVTNENNYHKINTGVLSGFSDTIAILPNRVVFIEFKTETGKQSDKQIKFQSEVQASGHEYFIVRSESEFIRIFEAY